MRAIIAIIAVAAFVAGCASMGRYAQNYERKFGVYVEHDGVSTFCLTPSLRHVINSAERHFNAPVVVTSGYRNPFRNWRNGGARHSYHKKCMAADVFVPGVPKSALIAFMVQHPGVGGLGCYPGRKFIHVDVRNRPAGAHRPVTFEDC